MADQDSVRNGRRMFRQRGEVQPLSSSPALSGNDWPPTQDKVGSIPPRHHSMAVAAEVEDSETEVGTISSAAQRRRRRRQQLAQKTRPPPAAPDSPPSIEPDYEPDPLTRHPRTRQSSLARTATGLSMRPSTVPGLTRSQTAPHRWPPHIYEEEADNSRSDSRRSGSRRNASPLYRSMTGSKLSSRTSLSDEGEEDVHTDDTTSTPEEIRVIRKHKSVQQQKQSRNVVPPPAPPPPRVPNLPTRRGEVIYEEDGDSGHHTPKSKGHSRPGTVYEFDMQDVDESHRRRARSRLGRMQAACESPDLDMKRIEQRTRSKSRARSVVAAESEKDVDVDREESRRAEMDYQEDQEKRLRARSRPRQQEQSFDAADDNFRRSKSRVRRAETVYDLDMHDYDHRRSKSKPRGAETDYEIDTEDMHMRKRSRSKPRRAENIYELDMPPQEAPEPPRTRRGEAIYEEDGEMVALRHNPFGDQSRSRSRHSHGARTERQQYSPRKEPRRRNSVDEPHPRSHSRSDRYDRIMRTGGCVVYLTRS